MCSTFQVGSTRVENDTTKIICNFKEERRNYCQGLNKISPARELRHCRSGKKKNLLLHQYGTISSLSDDPILTA